MKTCTKGKIKILTAIIQINEKYTRQQKKMCILLWWSFKDFIFNVQNSYWYHFKACSNVFKNVDQTLFYVQYTIHYLPLKFIFCREKTAKSHKIGKYTIFLLNFFVAFLFFKLMINPNNQFYALIKRISFPF